MTRYNKFEAKAIATLTDFGYSKEVLQEKYFSTMDEDGNREINEEAVGFACYMLEKAFIALCDKELEDCIEIEEGEFLLMKCEAREAMDFFANYPTYYTSNEEKRAVSIGLYGVTGKKPWRFNEEAGFTKEFNNKIMGFVGRIIIEDIAPYIKTDIAMKTGKGDKDGAKKCNGYFQGAKAKTNNIGVEAFGRGMVSVNSTEMHRFIASAIDLLNEKDSKGNTKLVFTSEKNGRVLGKLYKIFGAKLNKHSITVFTKETLKSAYSAVERAKKEEAKKEEE